MKDYMHKLGDSKLDEKTIPSRVFFNHFWAISEHLKADPSRFKLKEVEYFNKLKSKRKPLNIEYIRKLLWNSWSTEYAFHISSSIDTDDYYKFAMHWNFPQAYYSVYLAMTAFQYTQEMDSEQHEKSIKRFGNGVKDGHYPQVIGFYAYGHHKSFEYHNLDSFESFPFAFTQLSYIRSEADAQTQIASFLKSTRIKNAEHKKIRLEAQNDSRFHTAKKTFTKKLTPKHWNLIYMTLPQTTILNLLYRLRIKANYQDIESFIHADINFKEFHKFIGEVMFYLNYVHESYILKVVGETDYLRILNGFSKHLNKETAVHRFKLMKEEWM
jgi:hypothetical protein